mgnify:CR=1 FL=1
MKRILGMFTAKIYTEMRCAQVAFPGVKPLKNFYLGNHLLVNKEENWIPVKTNKRLRVLLNSHLSYFKKDPTPSKIEMTLERTVSVSAEMKTQLDDLCNETPSQARQNKLNEVVNEALMSTEHH